MIHTQMGSAHSTATVAVDCNLDATCPIGDDHNNIQQLAILRCVCIYIYIYISVCVCVCVCV